MKNNRAFKTRQGRDEVLKYYDMLLEKLTIPYERLNISTRHGSTFSIAAGDISAPPVVLLHGSSMNSSMWISDIMLHSMETADRMKRLVPDTRINILPDRGHSIINLADEILEQIK